MSTGWIAFCIIIGFILIYFFALYVYYKIGLNEYEKTYNRTKSPKI